jgi:hypothetical protein
MTTRWIGMVMVVVVVAATAVASAQPADDDTPLSGYPGGSAAGSAAQPQPQPAPPAPGDPYAGTTLDTGSDTPPPTPPPKPKPPRPPDPPIAMPELLRSPTGWLLPAAVIYSKSSLDTGGGVTTTLRVGLGDVAEFGVSTLDTVRATTNGTDDTVKEIQPYVTATFRMGVAENRLFTGQPAVALGFEKSFEFDNDNFKTQTAELTLVASKHLGKHAAIHLGGAFWDASIESDSSAGLDAKLDNGNIAHQIRPFGGIQVEPIDRAELLIDLSWAPEFCYVATSLNGNAVCPATNGDAIHLQPELSWGVRYRVTDWMNLESGVRLPNIGKADLLDAEIFGSVTFTSWALSHLVRGL